MHAICYYIVQYKNGGVVGDLKRLILATTVEFNFFLGFHVCWTYFFGNFQNGSRKMYLQYLIDNVEKMLRLHVGKTILLFLRSSKT